MSLPTIWLTLARAPYSSQAEIGSMVLHNHEYQSSRCILVASCLPSTILSSNFVALIYGKKDR